MLKPLGKILIVILITFCFQSCIPVKQESKQYQYAQAELIKRYEQYRYDYVHLFHYSVWSGDFRYRDLIYRIDIPDTSIFKVGGVYWIITEK